eukprot:m.41452 g.41452  ORF g.41452 m.41452 type:complete len:516 (+) comp6132_c0_seq1:31-1578(+)
MGQQQPILLALAVAAAFAVSYGVYQSNARASAVVVSMMKEDLTRASDRAATLHSELQTTRDEASKHQSIIDDLKRQVRDAQEAGNGVVERMRKEAEEKLAQKIKSLQEKHAAELNALKARTSVVLAHKQDTAASMGAAASDTLIEAVSDSKGANTIELAPAGEPWPPSSALEVQKHYDAVMAQHATWTCDKPPPGYAFTKSVMFNTPINDVVKNSYCESDDNGKMTRAGWTIPRGLVALTTIPNRMTNPLANVPVQSILQSHPTWPVYLIVPRKPARADLGAFPETMPQWMAMLMRGDDDGVMMTEGDVARFRVVHVDADRGPTDKLLAIVEKLGKALRPDDMIITIDDDRKYKPDMMKVTIGSALTVPHAIISNGGTTTTGPASKLGVMMSPPEPLGKEWHHPGYCNRLQGFGGVLYRRKFITPEWFTVHEVSQQCVFEDDTWFSMMAYYSGCPIYIPGIQKGVDGPYAWKQDMKTGLSDQQGTMSRGNKVVGCETAVLVKKNHTRISKPRWLK